MMRLNKLLVIFLLGLLLSTVALAQTPPMPEDAGIGITFTLNDVMDAMTESERLEFQELRVKMKKNKASQRQVADDPDSVALLEQGYQKLKTDFENKFGFLRGLRGASVTVYGWPIPSRAEVMNRVVFGRASGGDGKLYPHWYRERGEGGAVVGSNTRPSYKVEGPVYLAGDEVVVKIPIDGEPVTTSTNRDSSCEANAGPRPSYPNPKCKCVDSAYGVDTCWWHK